MALLDGNLNTRSKQKKFRAFHISTSFINTLTKNPYEFLSTQSIFFNFYQLLFLFIFNFLSTINVLSISKKNKSFFLRNGLLNDDKIVLPDETFYKRIFDYLLTIKLIYESMNLLYNFK